MLIWTEEVSISTLVKPDEASIEKAQKQFLATIRKLIYENPEFDHKIMVGRVKIQPHHDIELSGKIPKLSVMRLIWRIKSEKDILESFLRKWKEMDENPCHCFFARSEPSISEIRKMMAIQENE